MKNTPFHVFVNKSSLALLLATAFGFMSSNSSYAMSELISLSVEPEWPTSTQPGTVILYKVTTIGRAGQGLLDVSLSSAGLPEGTTVSFSPNYARFTGRTPTNRTSLLSITCPRVMPTEIYPFTITARAQRESITITNEVVMPGPGDQGPITLMVDRLSDTSMRFRGKGASGLTYQIESTPDLVNPVWTPVGLTTADGNGRFVYFQEIDKTVPMRFFRAVPAPLEAQVNAPR